MDGYQYILFEIIHRPTSSPSSGLFDCHVCAGHRAHYGYRDHIFDEFNQLPFYCVGYGSPPTAHIGVISGTTGVSDAFVYGPPDIGTNLGCYTAPCLNWNIRATGSQDPSVASAFLGAFAVNVNVSQTPLPAALPLFATGLGLMGLLGWRRKRKAQAAA
jgi:hypothetical protein